MSFENGALNTAMPPVATAETTQYTDQGQGVASPDSQWSAYGQVQADGSVSNPDGGFEVGPTKQYAEQTQPTQDSGQAQQIDNQAQDEGEVDTPDELGRIPYQRFQSVIGERNTLRTEAAEYKAKLAVAERFLPFIESGILNQILEIADSPEALQRHLAEQEAQTAAQSVVAEANQAVGQVDAQISMVDNAEEIGEITPELATQLRTGLHNQRNLLIDTYTRQRDMAASQARYEPFAQQAQAQSYQAQLEATLGNLKAQYPNLDEHSVRRELTLPGGQADAMARAQAEAQRTNARYLPTTPTPAQMQAQAAMQRNQIAQTRQTQAPQVPSTSTNGGTGAIVQAQSNDELNQLRRAAGLAPLSLRRG